jgi:hypothetical protein
MTIVVGVVTPDGAVLAADSRTTWTGDEGRHRIVSDASQKVFDLCGRFGVATYGLAFIADKTIAGLMDEFVTQLPDNAQARDVQEFARQLGEFFNERFQAWVQESGEEVPNGWLLGFLVAGYDSEGIGHIVEVGVLGADFGDYSPNTAERGVMWRGQTDVIRRLVKGVALDELGATGVDLSEEMMEALAGLEYNLILPVAMQDAVDFAVFLIEATINMQRFSDGTQQLPGLIPACGGPAQLLTVTRSGVDWIGERALVALSGSVRAEGSFG